MENAANYHMEQVSADHRNARILIIDDEEPSAALLAKMLERAGFAICITIGNPQVAAERFEQIQPDIVLLDLHMGPIDGLEVLRLINASCHPRHRPPVLMFTGDTSIEARREALAAGATDFLAKPLDPLEVSLRVQHLLTARALIRQCQIYSRHLEQLVEERTGDLQRRTHDLERTLSELRDAQQQVIQQERLRALGTMASGIAHDLNNGLTIVLGYCEILTARQEEFQLGETPRRYLAQIMRSSRDSSQLVKRLRDFYRPRAEGEERQAVDLNEVVEQAISLTSPRWRSEAGCVSAPVRIETDLSPLPVIAGAPADLRGVMTNLILNAVDAMPSGGTLRFATRKAEEWVEVKISDSGIGMTEETRRSCFEPFYTTKGDRGSGLGLATSYGVIRRHGGTITVESHLNKGSTFVLRFPTSETAIMPAVNSAPSVKPLHVLVVDDNSSIREIVSAYLAEDRHIVETAEDANEAMEKYRSGNFDLVITDRAMPETNGDELASAIKRMHPREPVIMLTAFADFIQESGQRSKDVDLLLGKPACLDDLRRAISKVMVKR